MDVHDWNVPVLKGVVWSEDLDNRVLGGSFYSAFVDTSRISIPGEPVWVFAASNTCPSYPDQCNDTVYIFNIREILDAPADDPGLPITISAPDAIWYPGINSGFPPGPDSARGHDLTVHENRLLVTNPGGGLYVVDTDPLFDQMTDRPPMELARCEYLNPMTHDAWATEDLQYVFTSDEYFFAGGCARPIGDVTVYDLEGLGTPGLCNIRQAAKYVPSTAVTSHYVYVREDLGLGYVANYSRGVRIIDVSIPEDPIEVGYYDTYLGPDIPAYVFGTVDVWPFYKNYISALDHYQGVFVLQFDQGVLPACQGGSVQSAAGGIPIEGAWVYSLDADRGALSDENGHFELKTAKDQHTIVASALGFAPKTIPQQDITGRDCSTPTVLLPLQSNSSNLATAWNNGTKVVVDSAGGTHVVYQNITLPHNDQPATPMHSVTYAYSTDRGITWDFTSFEAAYYPSLAVDPNKVPHIVLLEHASTGPPPNEHLVHYWKDGSGQWQKDIIVSIPDKIDVMFTPAVAIYGPGPQGYYSPHVVWEQYSDSPPRTAINYWTSSLGGPEEILSAVGLHSLRFPSIAIDGGGKPHVLWQNNNLGEIQHSYREGTNNWHQPPLTVASGASHPCADESEGEIFAVWEQGSPLDISIGRFTGTTWETCPISDTDTPSQFPVLEDSNVVWSEPTQIPGDYEVLYSKWDGGLGAELTCGTPPENLSGTTTPSMYPQGCFHFIVNPWDQTRCHRFYVTWTEDRYSHQRLMFTEHVPPD